MTRSRPGFTLLETMLAVMLGSLVLAAALSLFVVMQRAQDALFSRADANVEIARVHRTMQRTFSSLLMLDTPPTATPSQTGNGRNPDTQGGANREEQPEFDTDEPPVEDQPPLHRLALTIDPRFPGRDIQRLEVVLSSPPIPADPVHSEANAWADAALELDTPDDDTPGLRGAFILAESAPDQLDDSRAQASQSGWTLWWIPRTGDRVRVATGLAQFNWIVARSENDLVERHREYTASTTDELPNFMEVELVTVKGQRSSMMFEIGWTIGEEPAEPTSQPGEEPTDQPGGAGGVPTLDALPLNPGGSRGGRRPSAAGGEDG